MIVEETGQSDSGPVSRPTPGTSNPYTPHNICPSTPIPSTHTPGSHEHDISVLQTLTPASRDSRSSQLTTPVTPLFTPVSQTDAHASELLNSMSQLVTSSIVTLHSPVPYLVTQTPSTTPHIITKRPTSPCSPRSLLVTRCLPHSFLDTPRSVSPTFGPRPFLTHLNTRPPRQRMTTTHPYLLSTPPPMPRPLRTPSPRLRSFHPAVRTFINNAYPNPPSLGANYAAPPFPMCPSLVDAHPPWVPTSIPSHGLNTRPGISSAGHNSRPQSPVSN